MCTEENRNQVEITILNMFIACNSLSAGLQFYSSNCLKTNYTICNVFGDFICTGSSQENVLTSQIFWLGQKTQLKQTKHHVLLKSIYCKKYTQSMVESFQD